jgi:hypothetical protein
MSNVFLLLATPTASVRAPWPTGSTNTAQQLIFLANPTTSGRAPWPTGSTVTDQQQMIVLATPTTSGRAPWPTGSTDSAQQHKIIPGNNSPANRPSPSSILTEGLLFGEFGCKTMHFLHYCRLFTLMQPLPCNNINALLFPGNNINALQ